MRFYGILCLVLLLLLTPILGIGDEEEDVLTWEDFVADVHQQLEDAPDDAEIVYTPRKDVASYHHRTEGTALRVPQGKSLVLQGGNYAGLLIEAGDITLEDCFVTATKNSPIRIRGNYNKQAPILLTIGEGTKIEASGKKIAAIETTAIFAMDIDINIENYGTIISHNSAGVYIDASPIDWGSSSVRFENHGEISAEWAGIDLLISAEGGNAMIEFLNTGTIHGRQWAGLAVTASSEKGTVNVFVENEADGSLLSDQSNGLWLDTYDGRGRGEGSKGTTSATYLRNDGVITGQLNAVTFRTTYVEEVLPLRVVGAGEYRSYSKDMHALQVYMRGNFEEKRPPAEEDFVEQMQEYVKENGLAGDGKADWLDATIIVRTGAEKLLLGEDGALYHWYSNE